MKPNSWWKYWYYVMHNDVFFWIFQNNLLPSGEKRRASKTLIIDSVDRHEAGVYVCRAHNGVGVGKAETAEAQINLQVLCKYLKIL